MTRRIPSLNWLRVFEAAARTGSFARAAEALSMSPPAVGQQIKALETHLGQPLFTRGPQSVTLTKAGKAFLPSVASSLHTVELATGALFGDSDAEILTVQCTLVLACGWLAERLPDFLAAHPDIRVTLNTAVHDVEYQSAASDIRISFAKAADVIEDSDPLFGERLIPAAPPEIARQIHTAEDLTRWPLIEVATHRANWFGFLPADGPAPRFMHTDNTLTAFALAASGGIALDRAPATGNLCQRYGLEHCLADSSISGVQHYTLIYPARSALRRAGRKFREWLLDAARGL